MNKQTGNIHRHHDPSLNCPKGHGQMEILRPKGSRHIPPSRLRVCAVCKLLAWDSLA
jgi:hypothetical protein